MNKDLASKDASSKLTSGLMSSGVSKDFGLMVLVRKQMMKFVNLFSSSV